MKIPTVKIKSRKPLKLWLSSDWHYGHENCNGELLLKYVDYIKQHKGKTILLGDLMEASIPGHMPQTMFSQDIQPHTQFDLVKEILGSTDVIAAVSGNHENRIYNSTGIDVMKEIAKNFKAVYLPAGGYFNIDFNGITYRFAIFHGSKGSQNPRYQLLKALNVWPDCDIMAMGHIHHLCLERFYRYGIENGERIKRIIYGVRTGGFLEYPGYAQKDFYPLSATGSPIVTLNPKRKKIDVDLSGDINGH